MPKRLMPDWPILMTAHTASAYLDCVKDNGKIRCRWAWWRRQPGFTKPDKASGMYYRPAIDEFFKNRFGSIDPIEQSRRSLEARYGLL